MRLLKFEPLPGQNELEVVLQEYFNEQVPPYAILSHRWGRLEDEVTFDEISQQKSQAKLKKGYEKVISCCRQALQDGVNHAWIDTCCIDKASSAELSEAIISMFKWYKQSHICYSYLEDVDSSENYTSPNSQFRNSQWFTRGWTLQEMIAPDNIRFYDTNWSAIGEKREMTKILSEITSVEDDVLLNPIDTLDGVCISQKMFWASKRRTTRIEDRAYSLLGLFNVRMPIMYGEGAQAFMRLQECLIGKSFDHTIFAWYQDQNCSGLLAESPDCFARSKNVLPMSMAEYASHFEKKEIDPLYAMTNVGLHIALPHMRVKSHLCLQCAFLACRFNGRKEPIFIYIREHYGKLPGHYFRTRKSSGSLGTGLVVREHAQAVSLARIFVAKPEVEQLAAIRPVLSDTVANQQHVGLQELKSYRISLFFQGKALLVYPMADYMGSNEVTIDIEDNNISMVLVQLRPDCTVWVILALVNGDLMSHIQLKKDIKRMPSDLKSCERLYDNLKMTNEIPSAQVMLNVSDNANKSTHYDNDIDEMASIDEVIYYNPEPRRKVFLLWLKVGFRKDISTLVEKTNLKNPKTWTRSLKNTLTQFQIKYQDSALQQEYLHGDSSDITHRCDYFDSSDFISDHAPVMTADWIAGKRNGRKRGMAMGDSLGSLYRTDLLQRPGQPAPVIENVDMFRTPQGNSEFFNEGYVSGLVASYLDGRNCYRNGRSLNYALGYAYRYASEFSKEYSLHFEFGVPFFGSAGCQSNFTPEYAISYAHGRSAGHIAGYIYAYSIFYFENGDK